MKNLIPVLESLGIDVAISLDDDYETEFDPARQGILRIDDFLRAYRGYFSDCDRTVGMAMNLENFILIFLFFYAGQRSAAD